MTGVNVLHLSDVHLGMRGTRELWPQAKAIFFEDLQYMYGEFGRVDLIAFTGDFAFSGADADFAQVDDFLLELMEWFEPVQSAPTFLCVPGNHDLQRPTDGGDPRLLAIRKSWQDVQDSLWDTSSDVHAFIRDRFAGYKRWLNATGYQPSLHPGLLPGDFSVSVEVGGKRIGVLGLNSTFRQLTVDDDVGDLSIGAVQIQAAARGDLPRWAASHDVCILMTHHPRTWLDDRSKEDLTNLVFNGPNAFRLHLFGHQHKNQVSGQRLTGPSMYYEFQAPSLFGLEHYGKAGEKRTFGYSVITIDLGSEAPGVVIAPREAHKQHDGAWQLDVSRQMPLPKGKPFSNRLPLPPARRPAEGAPPRPAATGFTIPSPHFRTQLENGRFVLLLGEGLEGGAETAGGDPVARFDAVRKLLAAAANVADEPGADLHNLWTLAVRGKESALRQDLASATEVRSGADHPVARTLSRVPFTEIYDLTPGNALTREFSHDRSVVTTVVRTIRSDYPLSRSPGERTCLKVHGTSDDPVFQWPAPGDRLSASAQWFARMSDVLASYPILMLTDDVDAWNFWRLLELRGPRGPGSEIRPRSYLLTPELSEFRQRALADYNAEWVPTTVAGFVEALEGDLAGAVKEARARSAGAARAAAGHGDLQFVDRLRENAQSGSRAFLLGYEPSWGDALGKYAIERTAETDILQKIDEGLTAPLVVVGTAGSGKSTLLKRVALALDARGEQVAWIDRAAESAIQNIEKALHQVQPGVLIVDDIDMFGGQAARFLGEAAARQGMIVIASVRSARMSVVHPLDAREDYWLDRLSDTDVNRLMAVLRRADLLGRRFHATDADLRKAFEQGDRQLLVAMIEITSGMKFREKIRSELFSLDRDAQVAYAVIAFATHLGERASRDVLRLSVGAGGGSLHRILTNLVGQRLVLDLGDEQYSVRHRLIADEVLGPLRESGLLVEVIADVMQACGTVHARDRQERPGMRLYERPTTRLLIRAMSHQQLITLGLSVSEAREVYDRAQEVLRGDFHYHLQRGSYELEAGELEFARIELEQAKALEPDDYKVITEWAYMRLRVACANRETDPTSAIEALSELENAIARHGNVTPHTFVVLAREGIRWLDSGLVPAGTAAHHGARIAERLRLGAGLHPGNREIQRALRDIRAWEQTHARPDVAASDVQPDPA